MTYADEDEIDWSDGSFDDPPQKGIDTFARPTQSSPSAEIQNDQDYLLVSEVHGQHRTSCSLPPESGKKPGPIESRLFTLYSFRGWKQHGPGPFACSASRHKCSSQPASTFQGGLRELCTLPS